MSEMVYETVKSFDRYELEDKAYKVIENINKALETIPEKYRASAYLDIDSYDDSTQVYMKFQRPPNEVELEARKKADEQRANWQRCEYERLKKIFDAKEAKKE